MPRMVAEYAYLQALTGRLRRVLGDNLVGVYVGGSYALGGYVPDRSDLDVAVVVPEALGADTREALVAVARDEALPVPARKLELVVYRLEDARAGGVEPAFELNLNTGPGEFLADVEPRTGEGHWFAIDRSVLAQSGIALFGPPAADVFTSPPRKELLPILAQVLRWYQQHEPDSEAALLNAGRALRFARDGLWVPKTQLWEWAEQAGADAIDKAIAKLERG